MADATLLVEHCHRVKGLIEAGQIVVPADVLSEEEVEHRPPCDRRGQMVCWLNFIVLASWLLAGISGLCHIGQ